MPPDPLPPPGDNPDERLARLARRVERERRARLEAESLLEEKSRALFIANRNLAQLAASLETRVAERTLEANDARERAVALAERDSLTGIANRVRFTDRLGALIAQARQSGEGFALLLLDLDRFKETNDALGHEAGDTLLRCVARRLVRLPGAWCVARLGGDEFAAIVPATEDGIEAQVQALQARLRKPLRFQGQRLEVSASIGVALFPQDATDSRDLQRFADIALFRAKVLRDCHARYEAAMGREIEVRRELGSELARALRIGEVVPWFQPIVDGTSLRPNGVEALARWHHPQRGLVSPGDFLAIAEERRLMGELFARILRAACPVAKRWLAEGVIQFLSVNVSPSQFRSGNLVQDLAALLSELDFPAECLVVEITEEILMLDLDGARRQLQDIAALGVRIALDDFGVGYSNIGYLRHLPFHKLKLDRSLIADLGKDPKVRVMLSAIVDLARALDLGIVAEGVEDPHQALLLAHLGCRDLQGYLFGRPMPEAELDAFFRHGASPRRAAV